MERQEGKSPDAVIENAIRRKRLAELKQLVMTSGCEVFDG